MKIIKALNNNMILARRANGQELICQGRGITCGISAIVAGVTEPAMYGINLRYMKPMIGAVTAGDELMTIV